MASLQSVLHHWVKLSLNKANLLWIENQCSPLGLVLFKCLL